MLKKLLIGALVATVILVLGVFVWARSVLGQDTVRAALEGQLSQALGQPVSIGRISASIYPRVTVNLGDVTIGEPARIQARSLHVGTDFRALLSRRIEQARVRLDGARVELPLPAFDLAPPTDAAADDAPVEVVSIDEIVVRDMEIVSSGRSIRGDLELVPHANGLTVRRMSLVAGEAAADVAGEITDLSGPVADLTVKAGHLDLDGLLAFLEDFSRGAGLAGTGAQPAAAPVGRTVVEGGAPGSSSGLNVAVSVEAERAALAGLSLDGVSTRLRLTDGSVRLDPLAFGIFGGRYEGTLALTLSGNAPAFRWSAALSSVDVGAVMQFAGESDLITGTLSGQVDLTGQGTDAAAALRTARGRARVEIHDGIVRKLGLVRTVVVATSMRADRQPAGGSEDEPFSRLAATLAIAGGTARTDDLIFESTNLRLAAAGTIQLDGSATDLKGRVQLSDELSAQAGRDLVRYTRDEGRVTLPATIEGPADNLRVRIDMAGLAQRAIENRVKEEAEKAIKKGLGDLFKKR